MANDLENLNEKMNRSVLKDIRFEEKHKKHVMKTIKQSTKGSRKSRLIWTRKVNAGLSIGVSTALIAGVIYYGGDRMGLIPSNEQPSHQADKHHTETEPTIDPKEVNHVPEADETKEDTVYEPPKQKEYYGEMSEKEVLTKMINTVDHFKTATGKFEVGSLQYDGAGTEVIEQVEFQVSLGDPVGGFSKVTTDASFQEKPTTLSSYFTEGTVWTINEQSKQFREMSYKVRNFSNDTLTPEEAFRTDSDGIPVTKYRDRPPIGRANATLFPYEIASNFTRNYDLWEIEKQNEELLGHNTIVLKGILNDYAAKKFRSETFRFWVDKDTGILVQYETYDFEGEIVNYLHPKELNVNVPIDTSVFLPNLDRYEKWKTPKPEQDSSEQFVKQIAFAKGYDEESFKDVNSVLGRMRKEIAELYELNDSSLKLSLVDYETYKDIPQGVLLYRDEQSFQAGDTKVKNIRVRFQQEKAYHKEDFVNVNEKAKKVDEFELNGIRWEVRKDDRNIYYIGKKGDYTYEIVAEHYTLVEANKLLKTFKPSK